MAAQKFTRNKDYTDEADNNVGGRSTVDAAGLDGEMDELATVTDDHADRLDLLLRSDNNMVDDILQGHEFSSAALTILSALIGTNSALVWQGAYSAANVYAVGNFVEDSGSSYIALTAQTASQYANFAAALADNAWHIVAQKGVGSVIPAGSTANDILAYSGSVEIWSKLTAAMAPLHALKASPVFTGVMSLVAVTTGKISLTSAASINLDFNAGMNQQVSPLSVNTTFTTSNRALASGEVKPIDTRILADASGPYTMSFPAGWRWITTKPTSISASKMGFLSVRCYGTADADVVAAWSVES